MSNIIWHLDAGEGRTACGTSIPESTTDRAHVSCGRCMAADNAAITARAMGASLVTARVEQRNADGTLTVLAEEVCAR